MCLFAWDYDEGHIPWPVSADMNPALINFSAVFIIHPDKISAREFEASVSLMQDRASRPKHGIKWIQAYLPSWMQFFRNKFGANVEEDAKSRVGERGLLGSASFHTECYTWKRKSCCIDFPKLVPSTCVLTYNSLVTWLLAKFSTLFNCKPSNPRHCISQHCIEICVVINRRNLLWFPICD